MRTSQGNRGVALIITLGLLAVLTLLAVAFAIAMRVESMAARNYANMIRARHLVQSALSMAIDDINASCAGATYPNFLTNSPPAGTATADVKGSYGAAGNPVCRFFQSGAEFEASNAIPPIPRDEAQDVTARWVAATNGRLSYLIVNCSGLLDANFIGGKRRAWCTNVAELNLSGIISSPSTFTNNRAAHRRYETVQEVYAINDAVDSTLASNLFAYSFDPDRDQYFTNTAHLGSPNAVLKKKFDLNEITKYAGFNDTNNPAKFYTDAAFMSKYWTPLRDLLDAAGLERPDDVAWNIVNYLDTDRIPDGAPDGSDYRVYTHTEGGENTPLINEIVFRDPDAGTASYRFEVEVWYPFVPEEVQPSDGFKLQVGVFDNCWQPGVSGGLPPASKPSAATVMNYRNPIRSADFDIGYMRYGDPATEFKVFTTPTFTFPGNTPIGGVDSAGKTNRVWFLARVVKVGTAGGVTKTNVVDEAMGYDPANEQSGNTIRRALKKFDKAPIGYSINDCRSNGQCRYWDPTIDPPTAVDAGMRYDNTTYPFAPPCLTLGNTNYITKTIGAVNYKTQGQPIYFKNGRMFNVAELGHIYRNNLDDEMPFPYHYWRNIDLMNKNEGAALLDWMTVHVTNKPYRPKGVVSINSRQKQTLATLFHELSIGATNSIYKGTNLVDEAEIEALVKAIQDNGPYVSFRDMFTDGDAGTPADFGGPVAEKFRLCADGFGGKTNDILQEGAFYSIVEMISFRQNMFTVLLGGQALGKNNKSVVGEQRAMATVVRDSYTGKYFIRNFKWLTE